jgi:hypothetical protein
LELFVVFLVSGFWGGGGGGRGGGGGGGGGSAALKVVETSRVTTSLNL